MPFAWPDPVRTQALIVMAVLLVYASFAAGNVSASGAGNGFAATVACHCAADAQVDRVCVHDQTMHCPTYSACAGGMCAPLPVAIALDSVLATVLPHTPDRRAHRSLTAPPQSKPPAFI